MSTAMPPSGYPQGAGVFSDLPGTHPTSTFNNATYLRDIVSSVDLSGSILRVQGNGLTIADGATAVAVADGTDLGGRRLGTGACQRRA